MEAFYTSFAMISAGVSLAVGSVYLWLGIKLPDRAFALFGTMGLLMLVFLLLPPAGYILYDQAPYPASILIKRIFIFSYYGLTPWFILAYSGYPGKRLAQGISMVTALCYLAMFLESGAWYKPLWAIAALLSFGGILVLGLLAARFQYRAQQRQSAVWLVVVMSIYGVLFLITSANQLTQNQLAVALNLKLFFPIHVHALFFMLIMGQRMVAIMLNKHEREKTLMQSEVRWQSFLNAAPFIVVEIDRQGNVVHVNNYGLQVLGYKHLTEVAGLNWFSNFLRPQDVEHLQNLFNRLMKGEIEIPTIKAYIRCKDGSEAVMSWSNFTVSDADGEIQQVMSIGKDVTAEEKTTRLVEKLKLELLKEQVPVTTEALVGSEIVGSSKALGYAILKAKQVASTHAPVLLEGETGVGKELFADLIQQNSSRATMPFVKVNCGALPKELIEDELFGHEKGAFTSANQARKGRFELADGGTIFLDEIGELSLDMQPKLLRVLQSGEFERIGGQKTIKVDVRILAATNRNLAQEVQAGRFRGDLYYRLSVFPITIPPLRNRREDLPQLIQYFIGRKCRKYNKQVDQISKGNMQRLLTYDWPGNIRELKNVIERAVIESESATLQFDWWASAEELAEGQQVEGFADQSLLHVERDHILAVMEKCHWKINGDNGAAEMLAMHPNTLRSKMKRLGIKRPGPEVAE